VPRLIHENGRVNVATTKQAGVFFTPRVRCAVKGVLGPRIIRPERRWYRQPIWLLVLCPYCRAMAIRIASSGDTRWSTLSASLAMASWTPLIRPENSDPGIWRRHVGALRHQ